jgi:hypothetical protein
VERGRQAGQYENSGTDNGADTEHGEIHRSESALQGALTGCLGLSA